MKGLSWDYSHVTFSGRDEDGFPVVQADAYGDVGGDAFSLEHQYGFYSRPHDPTEDGFCSLIVAKDGSTRIGQLGFDPRFVQDIPLPPKGSSMQYVAFQDGDDWRTAFMFLSGDDGTLQFYRPTGDSAISLTVGLDGAGEPTFEVRHSTGAIIAINDEGKIILAAPGGGVYIDVSDDGIVLRGQLTQMGGMSPPGGVPLAKAIPMTTALGPLANALTAMAAHFSGVGDAATGAAAASAASSISSALADIPTTTTRGN